MTEEAQPTPVACQCPGPSVRGDHHPVKGSLWVTRRWFVPSPGPVPCPNCTPVAPRELACMGWALAPLVTLGLAAGPCFAYAALRLRSRALGWAAVGYAAVAGFVVWGGSWNSDGSSVRLDLGAVALLLLWGVSTFHALAVRRTVFFGDTQEDDSVIVAKERIRRRDESRRIAAKDPRLARELRIGRPDQPSSYDDGGLVDVNHAPIECLTAVGVIDDDLARRIVEARDVVGGFDSRADLESVIGLDPCSLDEVADLLIFCR